MFDKIKKSLIWVQLAIIIALASVLLYQTDIIEVSYPDRAICFEHQFNFNKE